MPHKAIALVPFRKENLRGQLSFKKVYYLLSMQKHMSGRSRLQQRVSRCHGCQFIRHHRIFRLCSNGSIQIPKLASLLQTVRAFGLQRKPYRNYQKLDTVFGTFPADRLPLLPPDYRHRPTVAPDPRHGWKELQAGKNRSVPYFGPGHPGVIRLVVRLGGRLSSCSVWWNRRRRLSSMLYSVHIH